MTDGQRTAWFFFVLLAAVAVFVLLQGCASQEHRRQRLQEEHPDCFVMHDLFIECPNPFVDSNAGFGVEAQNQKIKAKRGNNERTKKTRKP